MSINAHKLNSVDDVAWIWREVMDMAKVAMVTGAGQGIGEAIAKRLANAGYAVAVADLNTDNAQQVANEIKQAGGDALAVTVNVADRDQMFSAVQQTADHFGGFDVLVNNAGLGPVTRIKDVTPEMFDKVMHVNVAGDMWGIQAALEQFEKKPRQGKEVVGKIINATSQAGVRGNKNELLYSSTKFAVRGITQVAARDLAKQGITVNAYAPGIVDTPMMRKIAEDQGLKMSDYESLIALDKLSDPDDVAKVVEFLASDKADYITGQTILCDGGMQFE